MFRGDHNADCYFLNEYPAGCTDCRACAYCGKTLYHNGTRQNIHFDHLRAGSKGGRTKVPACAKCNQSKSDKSLKQWLRWLNINDPSHLQKIIDYNSYKRNKIALVVREVRDEL